jgi:hypothetical protein
MRRLQAPFLVVVSLSAICLLAGCAGGGSQTGQDHATHLDSTILDLRSKHGSGVSGTASFEDVSDGVLVQLELRNLPEPDTLYLAHIHPGTCSAGEKEEGHEHGEEHEGEHAEEGEGHEHGEEIEYALTPVSSASEGNGSSTTTLSETSVEKLFSGDPKHVNVHEEGSGQPPILACADLKAPA